MTDNSHLFEGRWKQVASERYTRQVNHDRQEQSRHEDPPGVIRGVQYQQCGGGRRIIRKKIGGV